MVKKTASKQKPKKDDTSGDVPMGIPEGAEILESWCDACEIEPSSKKELLWLQTQLQRCGIRSLSDLENLISRAE